VALHPQDEIIYEQLSIRHRALSDSDFAGWATRVRQRYRPLAMSTCFHSRSNLDLHTKKNSDSEVIVIKETILCL
jgi:hypothetical protein